MSLLHPFALWGLALIPLLFLLERWRRRPRPRVWPSLLLWRAVAGAEEPAARRIDRVLLLECAAIALLAVAAAEPVLATESRGRRVLFLIDQGRHLDARRSGGETAREATRAELDRIRAALDAADEIREVRVSGDLAAAAAGADPEAVVVLATTRPGVEGPGYLVVGRAPDGDNVGVDAVEVRDGRLWLALATDGAPRTVPVRVGDRRLDVRTGAGVETELAAAIEILAPDNYAGDDRVALRPFVLGVRDETGSRFAAAALKAGLPVTAGDDLVLTAAGGEPVDGLVRGLDCVAAPGLFEGLFLDECVWRDARTRAGDGLLTWRGRALAAWLDERTLWLGLPLDRDWDDQGTLAVVVDRAVRARAQARLADGEALVGEAVASPAPGLVDTKGVDRPWDGRLPERAVRIEGGTTLRAVLALLAAAVLALLLRAIVARP